jgi:hypothetical protein
VRAGRVARAALLVRGWRWGGVWLAPLVGKKLGAHQAHMQTSVRTHARCRLLTIGRLAPEAGSCEQFCLAHGSIDAARARRVCCRGWREA